MFGQQFAFGDTAAICMRAADSTPRSYLCIESIGGEITCMKHRTRAIITYKSPFRQFGSSKQGGSSHKFSQCTTFGKPVALDLPTMTVLSTLSGAFVKDLKSWFCIAGVLLAFLYVANAIRVWHHLRHIPGPWSAAWSKWWLIRSHMNGRTHLDLAETCEKYGTLILQKSDSE